MDLQTRLTELAEDHLTAMRNAPWAAFATSLRPGSRKDGETFGCEIDGVYFDIGDNVRWVDQVDGDILLTAHATAPDQAAGARAEHSLVIPRPK